MHIYIYIYIYIHILAHASHGGYCHAVVHMLSLTSYCHAVVHGTGHMFTFDGRSPTAGFPGGLGTHDARYPVSRC